MSDLVERLLHRLGRKTVTVGPGLYEDIHEAATALEAQAKELEALRGERDQWDRRVAYDELKAREYENRAKQQGQIDVLTIRAETAERERDAVVRDYQRVNSQLADAMRERDEAREAEPTTAMIDAGVAFALNVSLSGEYRWSQYVADLYKMMRAARAITGKD